jgi:hypothetical protein
MERYHRRATAGQAGNDTSGRAIEQPRTNIHCKRLKALKWMQAKAGDQPTAHHGQYFIQQAIRNYDVVKILRKKTHVTQITPFRPTAREQRIRTRQALETYPGSCKEQEDR